MDENGTDVILDEISGDEIQSVLDTLMGNSSISFMDYVASVSYTHLDVYKRQTINSAIVVIVP